MKMRSKFGYSTLIVGLLFAMALVPAADAQQAAKLALGSPVVKYPSGQSGIRPGADEAGIDIPFTYTPDQPLQNAVGQVASSVAVKFVPTGCNPYIIPLGSQTFLLTLDPTKAGGQAGGASYTETYQTKVTLKQDAPGLESLSCPIKAKADPVNEQGLQASNEDSASFTVKGTYIPLIQANVANGKLKATGPDKQIPYQLVLTNFGNAKTVITFKITDEPTGGKWSALAPEQITLNTEQSGLSNTQDIQFVVSTTYKNGWNNAKGGYTLELTPTAFIDPNEKGTATTVNVLARVRGVYVPGFEPFVMLAAIVGAALVARMNRDE